LEKEFGSSLKISGEMGRRSSYEITLTGVDAAGKPVKAVIWSKLASGDFPEKASLIKCIKQFNETKTVDATAVVKAPSSCVIA